jgi:hypothetical protein
VVRKIIFGVILALALAIPAQAQEAKEPETRTEIEGALRERQLEMALLVQRSKVIQGIEVPALQKRLNDLKAKEEEAKKKEPKK